MHLLIDYDTELTHITHDEDENGKTLIEINFDSNFSICFPCQNVFPSLVSSSSQSEKEI